MSHPGLHTVRSDSNVVDEHGAAIDVKHDNAGVMRRLAGVVIALAIVGLAVSGLGVDVGEWLASLFTNPS